MVFLYQKPPRVKLLLFSITFCQKIQTSVSVPGNVISQRLHCVLVHAYLMSISYLWLSISSVVVTMAQVVLSISKMLTYFLYLHLIWHGRVVFCCIFMEALGYLNHSPIILSIGHPHLPVLYPILWCHCMGHPFAQWVNPFCVGYGGFTFAQGEPYHRWESIWMLWQVMQQVLYPGIAPWKVVVVLKNNERVLQNKNNLKFRLKFLPFLIPFIIMAMSHTHLNSHVNFSTNL